MTDHLSREQVEALLRQAAEEMKARGQSAGWEPSDERPAIRLLITEEEMHPVGSNSSELRAMDEIMRCGRKTGLPGMLEETR